MRSLTYWPSNKRNLRVFVGSRSIVSYPNEENKLCLFWLRCNHIRQPQSYIYLYPFRGTLTGSGLWKSSRNINATRTWNNLLYTSKLWHNNCKDVLKWLKDPFGIAYKCVHSKKKTWCIVSVIVFRNTSSAENISINIINYNLPRYYFATHVIRWRCVVEQEDACGALCLFSCVHIYM